MRDLAGVWLPCNPLRRTPIHPIASAALSLAPTLSLSPFLPPFCPALVCAVAFATPVLLRHCPAAPRHPLILNQPAHEWLGLGLGLGAHTHSPTTPSRYQSTTSLAMYAPVSISFHTPVIIAIADSFQWHKRMSRAACVLILRNNPVSCVRRSTLQATDQDFGDYHATAQRANGTLPLAFALDLAFALGLCVTCSRLPGTFIACLVLPLACSRT